MNYTQLASIAFNQINYTSDVIPQNAFSIAAQLNIRVKNSVECRADFHDRTPLKNSHAVYALNKGEYTIYYDENFPYRNFSIAHEIAHHLLHHTSDGISEHHDAQLLAAIIIAPPQMVHKTKIRSAESLSATCKIPTDVAIMYWRELKSSHRPKTAILSIVIAVATIAATYMATSFLVANHDGNARMSQINVQENIQQETIIEPASIGDSVFVSSSGKKYHKSTCRHIKNSSVIELSIDKALEAGYEPCKDCIQ